VDYRTDLFSWTNGCNKKGKGLLKTFKISTAPFGLRTAAIRQHEQFLKGDSMAICFFMPRPP